MVCAPEAPAPWLAQQQAQLKQSHVEAVQATLAPHVEADEVADKAAPVRCCYRYLTNRPGQFDYQRALAAELPIGSGEIESAHRYGIQQRLKLAAGAWWKENIAPTCWPCARYEPMGSGSNIGPTLNRKPLDLG